MSRRGSFQHRSTAPARASRAIGRHIRESDQRRFSSGVYAWLALSFARWDPYLLVSQIVSGTALAADSASGRTILYGGLTPCHRRNSYKLPGHPETLHFTVGPPLRRRGFRAWKGEFQAPRPVQSTTNSSRRSGWTTVNRNGTHRCVCGANNDDGDSVDDVGQLCQPHRRDNGLSSRK